MAGSTAPSSSAPMTGLCTLSAQEGTRATGAGKKPVQEIRIVPVTASEITPAAGPHDSTWTGHAYHFLPDHASFDTPVLVSFTLSQDEWERSDPANLTIQETNETGPGWERLPTRVDPLTRTISAPARHFSIIGLFSTAPAGNPPENQQSPATVSIPQTGICPAYTAIIHDYSGYGCPSGSNSRRNHRQYTRFRGERELIGIPVWGTGLPNWSKNSWVRKPSGW